MQLNHKPLIGWLYRPIFEFGPGQNSISVSPPFSLRFSHPDPIKTENALEACYLIFRFPTGLFKIIIFYLFTLFFTIIFIFYFVLLHLNSAFSDTHVQGRESMQLRPSVGYTLIWPIPECAAGQGMVFDLSVLKRVHNPCEKFEPRCHFISRLSMIVRVNAVLNGAVFLDSD